MTEHPLTEEITVTRSGMPIATREYGGEGRPIVLIHGATANLEALDGAGRHLLPDHRVVAFLRSRS